MRRHDEGDARLAPRHDRRHQGGWTMYAPLHGDPPDAERHQRILEEASHRQDIVRRAREALSGQSSLFEAKARELLERDEVRIDAQDGWVQAKLVRFRRGAVFEHTRASSRGSGSGMTRIERSQLEYPVPLLAGYLQNAVLGLGSEPGLLR